MAIKDFWRAAEDKMEKAAKRRQYDKANRARAEKVDLQTAQAMCRGDLELCQRDFLRTIREQSQYIREGEAIGADTQIQQQILLNAAVGYLMVRDAIYSLRTINTHHTISKAYDMMDLATRQMSGKRSSLPLKAIRNRVIYGYATSEAAYQLKCDLVCGFYEELKDTGDIEHCLSLAQKPGTREAELRSSYTSDVPLPDRDPDPGPDHAGPQDTEEIDFAYQGNPLTSGIDYSSGK